MSDDELIQAIRAHLQGPPGPVQEARKPRPPVTPQEMAEFEGQIPQALPDLFKRLYLEIGDGGWGPWGGLCPLGIRGDENEPHFSVLEQYRYGEDQMHLHFCDGGCTVFSVLDLETGHIGLQDGDIEWQTDSLQEWLERWLSGENLMQFMFRHQA